MSWQNRVYEPAHTCWSLTYMLKLDMQRACKRNFMLVMCSRLWHIKAPNVAHDGAFRVIDFEKGARPTATLRRTGTREMKVQPSYFWLEESIHHSNFIFAEKHAAADLLACREPGVRQTSPNPDKSYGLSDPCDPCETASWARMHAAECAVTFSKAWQRQKKKKVEKEERR